MPSALKLFYTLRGFFGRGPLKGTGVSSRIERICIPFDANARSDDSLPTPTPFITTSTSLTPIASAFSPISSPTFAAANGVPFFVPLNPKEPLDPQHNVFPSLSVRSNWVLLYEDWMWRVPIETFFFILLEISPSFNAESNPPPAFLTVRFFPIRTLIYR